MIYHHKQIKIGAISTSKKELWDIAKAWIAISIAFGILLYQSKISLVQAVVVAAFSVGIGFLLHELAHKLVAQHYGCFAEFRSFDSMLILAIAMSFFGFVFAAPGAVMISGPVGRRRNGKISLAGPLMNYILAVMFLITLVIGIKSMSMVSKYGLMINAWLGLFNLIPFGNFDGKKILEWNKLVYGAMVAVGFVFMIFLMFF